MAEKETQNVQEELLTVSLVEENKSENGTKVSNNDVIEASEATTSVVRLQESGNVDVNLLTPTQKKHYSDIAKSLKETDLTTIGNYGSDLQTAMDSYSSDFLKQTFSSSNNVESAKLVSSLLGKLREVDIDDLESPSALKRLMRKIPGLKKLISSVEGIKTKYESIEVQVEEIVKKLKAARLVALRDNNNLQKQLENNADYVNQIGELIIAGKIKSQELNKTIEDMRANQDEYDDFQINNIENYKKALDKRITDLVMLRHAFKQSLTQIQIIQHSNLMNANNTEQQISMAIPLWKNQLSLAVALYHQSELIKANNATTDTTNDLLRKNSEMMKTQAIEVEKQNQRAVIDIDTLRKTTSDLVATVEGVQRAQLEGAQKRAAAEQELMNLERQMSQKLIGVTNSTQHIIAKELRNSRDSILSLTI